MLYREKCNIELLYCVKESVIHLQNLYLKLMNTVIPQLTSDHANEFFG